MAREVQAAQNSWTIRTRWSEFLELAHGFVTSTPIADPTLEIAPQFPCVTVADGVIWQIEHDRILGRVHERGEASLLS